MSNISTNPNVKYQYWYYTKLLLSQLLLLLLSIAVHTFPELHGEPASPASQVGAVRCVGADPALQGGRGGRRGPGHQVVG